MTKPPFKTPLDEAQAIDRLLEKNLYVKLRTGSISRVAKFRSDAMKAAIEIRIKYNKQNLK